MKPRLRAEELTGMISLLRDKFVGSENLRRCCMNDEKLCQYHFIYTLQKVMYTEH